MRLVVVYASAIIGLLACPAWAQSGVPVSWGAASNGLRFGISASGVGPAGARHSKCCSTSSNRLSTRARRVHVSPAALPR
jgi:hypothetical protein